MDGTNPDNVHAKPEDLSTITPIFENWEIITLNLHFLLKFNKEHIPVHNN